MALRMLQFQVVQVVVVNLIIEIETIPLQVQGVLLIQEAVAVALQKMPQVVQVVQVL
jgi:hypothetical protein